MTLQFAVHLDPTGFPMIKIPTLDLAIAWLPVTKIQFERYMCDTNLHDETWYRSILNTYTPRISPGAMTTGNYWNIFMTGILPAEAERFARRLGHEYRLPTAKEWKAALDILAATPANPTFIEDIIGQAGINERAAVISRRLEAITAGDANQLVGTAGRRLCDQMLMRLGVLEYVYEDDQMCTFAGWGQPNRRFVGGVTNPIREDKPEVLLNRTEGAQMKHFGFRVVRSGS